MRRFLKRLLECFFVWSVEDSDFNISYDSIIVLSFALRGHGISPCNKIIAFDVLSRAKMSSRTLKGVSFQWEIDDAVHAISSLFSSSFRVSVAKKGKYLDSEEVLLQSEEKISANSRKLMLKPLIVANSMHWPRGSWRAEKI